MERSPIHREKMGTFLISLGICRAKHLSSKIPVLHTKISIRNKYIFNSRIKFSENSEILDTYWINT